MERIVRINESVCLPMLIGVVWLVAEASAGQLIYAQAVPDEKAAKICGPCQSIEKFVPKAKPSPSPDASGDVTPPSFKGLEELKLKEVESYIRDGKECLKAVPTHTKETKEKDEPHCDLLAGHVRAFISKLETIKGEIESAQQKQNQLSEALRSLDGVRAIPGSRHDLPPRDVCSKCDELWADLNTVVGFTNSGKSFAVKNVDSGSAAAKVTTIYARASKELCAPRRRILDSPTDADAERVRYYTWTATWQAYQSLKKTLEISALEAFCQ
jgi:hypothetical protein